MNFYLGPLFIIFAYNITIHSMHRPDTMTPIAYRLGSDELIAQRSFSYPPKKDPENPRRFLKAPGPLLQLCLFNTITRKEEPLENSDEYHFLTCHNPIRVYFAAIIPCLAQFIEGKYIPRSENMLKVWNLNTRKIVFQSYTDSFSYKISPQEKYIAFDHNWSIKIHFLANGQLAYLFKKQSLSKPESQVPFFPGALNFSSNDRFIAYGENTTTQVIDLDDPQSAPALVEGHTPYFDGNHLVVKKEHKMLVYDLDHSLTDMQSGKNSFHLIQITAPMKD